MNSLTDVKKLIKEVFATDGQIRKVAISAEEFGEGYNVYVDVVYWQDSLKQESFTLVEEEKKSKAVARIKRVIESLDKLEGRWIIDTQGKKILNGWVMDGFGTRTEVTN